MENAIRPFVAGRKNWLFSGHPRGAAASAFLFSLIETAKANGLKPYAYMRHLFDQLPLAKIEEDDQVVLDKNIDLVTKDGIRLCSAHLFLKDLIYGERNGSNDRL